MAVSTVSAIPGIKKIVVQQYPKLTSWSFSRWSTYNECPARARYQYIDKMPAPESPQMLRGTQIHKLAEDYLKGEVKKLPFELDKLESTYAELLAKKPSVEQDIAFNNRWEFVDWKDGWCRIKIDVVVAPNKRGKPPTVHIGDHKTGGVDKSGRLKKGTDEKYAPQLELYAIAGFEMHPIAEQATTALYFIDSGDVIPGKTFQRSELSKLKLNWETRVSRMLNDTIYAPRPGFYCSWCPYRKTNNGPCVY